MPARPRTSGLVLALVLACVAGAACTSSDGNEPGAPDAATSTACAADTRKDVYAPGLAKSTAAALTVKVLDAVPAPPAKLTNTLTLQVLDAGGKPLDGASLSVVPFMPDHGHGSAVKPSVTAKGGGTYEVTNLYFPMPGLWRVTVSITLPDAAAQDAVFSFCVDG
ncbi:MAG: hypothetical protein JWP97_6569 [Labilithrix sp.]|nr:hypothetical protein [Labilithrix sp.]